jgi:hypothetical protein
MSKATANEPSLADQILSIVKLENPVARRIASTVFVVVGGGYLLLAAVVAEFTERYVDAEAGLKVVGAAVLLFVGLTFERVAQLLHKKTDIQIFGNEEQAYSSLRKIVDDQKIKRAKFFEYSAASSSVASLLKGIIGSGDAQSVKLLLFHPKEIRNPEKIDGSQDGKSAKVLARDNIQVNRILSNLENLSITTYQGAQDLDSCVLRIRCYEKPASLRGRNFDDRYVALGWYTYDQRARSNGDHQIWGAENPLIVAPISHDGDDVEELRDMFNKVFDDTWERATPLKKAVQGYQHWIDPSWLDAVSRRDDPEDRATGPTTSTTADIAAPAHPDNSKAHSDSSNTGTNYDAGR